MLRNINPTLVVVVAVGVGVGILLARSGHLGDSTAAAVGANNARRHATPNSPPPASGQRGGGT